ncbi:MAG: hypothetical protein CL930_12330, partial [Deltaproteobacteria bacterium]|nr:hypothetical protein [Deltaproteobacteria bacterium]
MAEPSQNDPTSSTLGAVLRQTAESCGDEPALLSDKRSLSWGQLDDEVDRLAALLVSLGVSVGDPVGFLITKRPEVVTGFLACARIGAVYSPVNFKLHPDHIRDQFETAKIKTVFTETQFDELLKGVLPLLPDPRKIIYIDGPGKYGQSHYGQIEDTEPLRNGPRIHPDTPCYYNYTSGTTGRPKGAVTTHRNILANGISTIDALGFLKTDVFLGMFSVFAHPHELFHRSLLLGGPFVILDTLSPRIVAASVERFGVTWMMAVPSFYEMMLDHHDSKSGHNLSSLRTLEAGGAYVGGEALARLEARCAGRFLPVWGCTEATGVALANGPTERRDGATGRAVPGYEIRIVDDRGRSVETGAVGEMI